MAWLLVALLVGDPRVGAGVRERAAAAPSARVVVRVNAGVELPLDDLRRIPAASIVRGRLRGGDLEALLATPGVEGVDLDPPSFLHLPESVPQVVMPPVHDLGLLGEGATVAVIDTGVWADHPDLAGAVIGEACFCGGGCCYNGEDTDFGPGAANDATGHGTHVAGVVASAGGQAAIGTAPAASIVAVKVFDENEDSCCTSDMVAALDWILNERPDVDVINMSFGSGDTFAGICDAETTWTQAYAEVLEQLAARGTVVIASSGNDQSGEVMTSPACLSGVISVGAVWDRTGGTFGPFGGGCVDRDVVIDRPACFGNSNAFTDLMAPGAIITSTDLRVGGTRPRVGTSHAAPFAAGCAAAIKGHLPDLDPTSVRDALTVSDTWVTDDKNGLSFPRLDCHAALMTIDSDLDGVIEDEDNCTSVANPGQHDADGDGAGDPCDPCPFDSTDDADLDGTCEDVDNCPGVANDQSDADTDGAGDTCDPCPLDPTDDKDLDGTCEDADNCPGLYNDQLDSDEDGAGDACDPCPLDPTDDADGDQTCEDIDNCPGLFNHYQEDSDGDGIGDACDPVTELPRPSVPAGGCAAVPISSGPVAGLWWWLRRRRRRKR